MKRVFLMLIMLTSLTACGGAEDMDFDDSVTVSQPVSTRPMVHEGQEKYDAGWVACKEYRIQFHRNDESFDSGRPPTPDEWDNYEAALQEAIRQWNGELGEERFSQVDDDKCELKDINANVAYMSAGGTAQKGASGSGPCQCAITINIAGAGDWKNWAHEMGHCQGLGHSQDPTSLMASTNDTSDIGFNDDMIKLVKDHTNYLQVGPQEQYKPFCPDYVPQQE